MERVIAAVIAWGGATAAPLVAYAISLWAAPPAEFAATWGALAAVVVAGVDYWLGDDEE